MTIFDEVAGGPSSSPAELSVLSLCTGHAEDTTATETTPDGMERPGLAIHIYFGDPHDVVPVEIGANQFSRTISNVSNREDLKKKTTGIELLQDLGGHLARCVVQGVSQKQKFIHKKGVILTLWTDYPCIFKMESALDGVNKFPEGGKPRGRTVALNSRKGVTKQRGDPQNQCAAEGVPRECALDTQYLDSSGCDR
jgi:hypothetical protein